MILIDTNIISEYLKHDPDAGVKALFAAEPELALSVDVRRDGVRSGMAARAACGAGV